MRAIRFIRAPGLVVLPIVLTLACAGPEAGETKGQAADTVGEAGETAVGETPATSPEAAPSLQGTWRLASRETADGSVLRPPEIQGAFTWASGLRNFNVFWTGPEGKRFSYSLVSEYELAGSEYRETVLFSVMNDEITGAGLTYELSRPSATAAVTVEDGSLSFDMPFDPVRVRVTADSVVARAEDGSFVDHWVRVGEE